MKGCKVICFGAVMLATSTGAHGQEIVAPHASSSRQTSKLLSLNFKQAQVAVLLQFIADAGGIDVVIAENVTGTLPSVQLTNQTPEQCLQWVAKAAGLRLFKLNGKTKTFLVDKPATISNSITQKITLSINIHEMTLPDAFRSIARKGNVQIFLDDSVQGLVKNFVLNNVEPVEALQLLASSSGCSFVTTQSVQPDGMRETECFIAKSRRSFPARPQTPPNTAPDSFRLEPVKPYNFRFELIKPFGQSGATLKIVPPPNVDPTFSLLRRLPLR